MNNMKEAVIQHKKSIKAMDEAVNGRRVRVKAVKAMAAMPSVNFNPSEIAATDRALYAEKLLSTPVVAKANAAGRVLFTREDTDLSGGEGGNGTIAITGGGGSGTLVGTDKGSGTDKGGGSGKVDKSATVPGAKSKEEDKAVVVVVADNGGSGSGKSEDLSDEEIALAVATGDIIEVNEKFQKNTEKNEKNIQTKDYTGKLGRVTTGKITGKVTTGKVTQVTRELIGEQPVVIVEQVGDLDKGSSTGLVVTRSNEKADKLLDLLNHRETEEQQEASEPSFLGKYWKWIVGGLICAVVVYFGFIKK